VLDLEKIIEATGGRIISKGMTTFSNISIDSRTIKEGDIFVALKGNRFDGHDFLDEALRIGEGAIVNSNFRIHNSFTSKTILSVKDTLRAIQDLARYIRKGLDIPVIGVVGSNGKTTTKELIYSILSTKLSVLKTLKNLNNHIGMPLCMINYKGIPDVMVLEMGTDKPGDIKELCNIALPDIGVITNIGYEHMAGFGSLRTVRDSEMEIMPYLKKVVVNADDEFLMDGIWNHLNGRRDPLEVIRFGINKRGLDVTARDIEISDEGSRFLLDVGVNSIQINLRIPGLLNIYNSIAAASIALFMGFNLDDIKAGLESFEGIDMRLEIKRFDGVTYINDTYNANPSSMEGSLNELIRILKSKRGSYKRAIVVFGDMLELGDSGIQEHIKLGRKLSTLPIDAFIGVGPLMSFAVKEFKGYAFSVSTAEDASAELLKILMPKDIVLIKGSRGMKMEKVLESIIKKGERVHAL
jgi:UDP-N-acetylmuramoyl-tripeptide--D-alanyl-D-alanine ligase